MNLTKMNMKKLLLISLLGAALGGIIGRTGPYSSQSFINGTGLYVNYPTNYTFTNTDTGVTYTNDLSQVVTAGTNAGGISYGAWGRAVRVSSDALGQSSPYTISVTVPATSAAGATNTIVLTFQRSADGINYDAVGNFAFTLAADLTGAGQTVVTNVPTAFTSGAAWIRCYTIAYSTNAAPFASYIKALRFNGFAP